MRPDRSGGSTKKTTLAITCAVLISSCAKREASPPPTPILFTAAHINDTFWAPIRLYSEEATEVHFTDYGHTALVSGRAHVEVDPAFFQTVTMDDKHAMRVFIQLGGDRKGVFVTNKTPTGFGVVELQGGSASVPFSYHVVCKRTYYEDERLATREQASTSNRRILETAWPEVLPKRPA
jgi:hypothetical protein